MKQLLEAGVHFGHHTRRWNPKMAEYIFTERNGVYIIDLQKTVKKLEEAYMFIREVAMEGGNILFTARQAPARTHFALPDLQSRMNIVPSVAINEPDDEMLSALILKLFTDRQIMVAPEIIGYIISNMQRSFAYARKLVAEIDSISLARKRAVSIAIVKEALSGLNDNHQGELFA